MEAIILKDYGGVENLQAAELPVPIPGRDEVLVSVKAISINPVDAKTRKGGTPLAALLKKDPPVILGWDVAGIVEQSSASSFKRGDAVFGMINFPGAGRAYASYITAPAAHLAHMPRSISFPEAAAASLAALTAWQALVVHASIGKNDRVLIHAGSGGVGHYAIQIARHLGAYVITTASSANREFVMSFGADEAIDYTTTPFEEVTGDIDFVLDTIGGDYIDRSIKAMKPGGTIISLPSSKNRNVTQAAEAMGMKGYPMMVKSDGKDMAELAALLETGEIRSHIAQSFPLNAVASAHLQIESGKTRGKLVVLP